MSGIRAIVVAGLLAAGRLAAADDNTIITPGTGRAEPPAKAASAGLGSSTLLIGLALAAVGGWMVWRNRRGTPIGRDSQALAVAETRSLGNRQFLVVASYDGQKFLLGVCPGRIEMLAPLQGGGPTGKARE